MASLGEETDDKDSIGVKEVDKQRHMSSMSVQPIELMTSNNVTQTSANY